MILYDRTRHSRKKVFLFSITLVFASVVNAQNNISAKADKIINDAMKAEQIPAIAAAIIQDGNVIYKKTFGVKTIGTKDKPDENTLFSIGSVSKAFTAIGLMTMVQKGQLVLDDPIKKYMKKLPAQWQNITVQQYMTHTSGIPNVKGEKDKESFESTLQQAANLQMAFTPGKKEQYNNFNFAVLGKMIESISGKSYLDFMKSAVFQPAGMNTTGVQPATRNIATGHLLKNGDWKTMTTHFEAGDYGVPSGGLQTTLADFIKLAQALHQQKLFNRKNMNTMWTPYSNKISNTPGWHSRMAGNNIVVHKGGGGTGIGSVCDFKVVPSKNIYIIIMANKAGNDSSLSELTDTILQKCFDIPKDKNGAGEGEGNER